MDRLYLLKDLDVNALSVAAESDGSGLLLMQDATYALNESREESSLVRKILGKGRPVYYLDRDVERRGLTEKLISGAQKMNVEGMVDLLFGGARVINV
jgi:sulfur relay protein TusB/DsrH